MVLFFALHLTGVMLERRVYYFMCDQGKSQSVENFGKNALNFASVFAFFTYWSVKYSRLALFDAM